MRTLIILSLFVTNMTTNNYRFDFGEEKVGQDWAIINDRVMGGKSFSHAKILKNSIVFEGTISLRNNGGFASLRNQGERIRLTDYKHVKVRFRTNTQRNFSFRLSDHNAFYRPFYKHEFRAKNSEWNVATMNLNDFKEYNLSGETGNWLTSDKMGKDYRMGIILYDKQEGPFKIEIDFIEFY